MVFPDSSYFRSGPYVCQIALLVYSVPNTGIQIVGCLLNWGLFGTLSLQLCMFLRFFFQQIASNAFSLDLYYLAFPNDSRLLKYLVYGIYVIESVQTILVAHDTFAMFGYGFGDMDALTRLNYNWITVPITSAVGAWSIRYLFFSYVSCVQRLVSRRSSMHTESS